MPASCADRFGAVAVEAEIREGRRARHVAALRFFLAGELSGINRRSALV